MNNNLCRKFTLVGSPTQIFSNPRPPAPKFDLIKAIASFIDLRDALWHELLSQAAPSPRDIGILDTANGVVKMMLELKPGPITPVLTPACAHVEMLRVHLCAVFISQTKREIAGRERPGGVHIRFVRASLELALADPEEKTVPPPLPSSFSPQSEI